VVTLRKGKTEEEMYRKNIKREVVLSPFILIDKNGELIFAQDVSCPRCGFNAGGEYAGAFECDICGYSEVEKYSNPHGTILHREAIWKILHFFLKHTKVSDEISISLVTIWNNLDAITFWRKRIGLRWHI